MNAPMSLGSGVWEKDCGEERKDFAWGVPVGSQLLEIRKAKIEDASRLAEIQVYGWRSAYGGFLTPEYLYGKMIVSKRIDAFSSAIANQTEEIYVVVESTIVKGFLIIGPARDSDLPDSFELWAVYIEPAFQLQGLGRALVLYSIEQAKARDYSHMVLWVFTQNEASRRFYERMGFSLEGKTDRIDFLDKEIVRYQLMV